MELNVLAQNIVALLAPALPYLSAIEGVGTIAKAGKAVPNGIKKIWEVLNYNIELRPAGLKEAIIDVQKDPDDSDARQMLEFQVKKVLKQDSGLAQELLAILQDDTLQKDIDQFSQTNQTSSGNQSPNVVSQGDVTITFGNDKK